ncbi:MAG: mediator complex, subunit Med21 [Monoraphidium minutum]|nr:MAG: mediator complex, subunit Med21 [Monoraphidium minutum]
MAELLTQLQDQLHLVSKMFFDFVGILQRDAPPMPLPGETLDPAALQQQRQPRPPPGAPPPLAFDVEATTALMASQLIEQFKRTEALITALPRDAAPAAAQYDRIRALQQEHADVSAELDAAAAEAEAQLAELQRMFAALAQQRLRGAARGVPAPPLPPMG